MNIGIVQLNTIIADIDGNMLKAKKAVEQSVCGGAEIVVLSELFITGYPPRDLIHRKDLIDANVRAVDDFIRWSEELKTTIVFGYVEPNPTDGQKDYFNTVLTVSNGKVVNKRRKTLLPTYDVFSEDRYFEAGNHNTEFVPFELNGVKIGVINCEEGWNDADFWKERLYSFDPVTELVANGAQYIVWTNASPYRIGIDELRTKMAEAHCKRHNIGLVYVNQVGYNDDIGFDGSSFAMNKRGEIIHQSLPFREDVVVFGTDAMAIPEKVLEMPWQHKVMLALQTGIRDYFNKLGIKGPAIIGLSGGIDSAIVAFLAATALGPDRVIGVGMPSRFSSDGSVTDAEKIAKKLGIHFVVQPIKEQHDSVRTALDGINTALINRHLANERTEFFGRKNFVKVADSGVTDENIQARLRGIYLMGISNFYNGIVLSTGNKSEMAVGYCTMYGDMCGGLSVISDLLKTKVFDLCRWINEAMRDEIIPFATIDKPPSAELRANQKDQDSLPPYPILDEIITKLVEEAKATDQIIKEMVTYDRSMKYKGETDRDLEGDIVWVCQKTMMNEFKRKQAPTGLKLTNKSFRFGLEWPIVHKLTVRGVAKQDSGAAPPFPLGGEKLGA